MKYLVADRRNNSILNRRNNITDRDLGRRSRSECGTFGVVKDRFATVMEQQAEACRGSKFRIGPSVVSTICYRNTFFLFNRKHFYYHFFFRFNSRRFITMTVKL